jgi:hypothetical protein
MNQTSQKLFDELTKELFVFLEDSVLAMQSMLGKLTELRAAVIRRDEKTLQQMSDEMSELTSWRDGMQQRQRQICKAFAIPLNCQAEKINISYLALFLESPKREELKIKQHLLGELVSRLLREHRATELLLQECERLNRMVLDGIVGKANQTFTYGSAGRVRREMYCTIMSTRI